MPCRMASMVYLIAAVALFKGATAGKGKNIYTLDWIIPPDKSDHFYTNWTRSKTFKIDDIIVFNWTQTHVVAEVSQDDYDCCAKTNPIGTILEISPANFTLDSNGTRYFICTIAKHCEDGQKVTIKTGEGNSASSLTVRTLSAIVSTIVIALLSY